MGKLKQLPSEEYLNECFCIKENSLVWKTRPATHFKTVGGMKSFNTQFSGKIAGSGLGRYLTVNIGGSHFKQHRILLAMLGIDLFDLFVDHDNGNPFDNSINNLSLVTHQQNMRNMFRYSTNKLGKSGLYILNNKDGTSFARFQWNESGKRRNKSFSIDKYGFDEALSLAETKRSEVINRLNLEGYGYSDRHGEHIKEEHVALATLIAEQINNVFKVTK
jgi:hypothetical protein